MGIYFNRLAGDLNPETQFISTTLDVANKSCCCRCLCPAPEGEGSFDRLEVAKAVETNITTRLAELQAMSKETLLKIQGNVSRMAPKLSRIGAWFRNATDIACQTAFQRAVETIATVISAKDLASDGVPRAGVRGAVLLEPEIGEARVMRPPPQLMLAQAHTQALQAIGDSMGFPAAPPLAAVELEARLKAADLLASPSGAASLSAGNGVAAFEAKLKATSLMVSPNSAAASAAGNGAAASAGGGLPGAVLSKTPVPGAPLSPMDVTALPSGAAGPSLSPLANNFHRDGVFALDGGVPLAAAAPAASPLLPSGPNGAAAGVTGRVLLQEDVGAAQHRHPDGRATPMRLKQGAAQTS